MSHGVICFIACFFMACNIVCGVETIVWSPLKNCRNCMNKPSLPRRINPPLSECRQPALSSGPRVPFVEIHKSKTTHPLCGWKACFVFITWYTCIWVIGCSAKANSWRQSFIVLQSKVPSYPLLQSIWYRLFNVNKVVPPSLSMRTIYKVE